jgi:hypothetical protein
MPAVAEELSKVVKFSSETKTKLRLQFEALEKQVFISPFAFSYICYFQNFIFYIILI